MAKITIEKLAKMIKDGFDKTATKEQFEGLEQDVSALKKDVNTLKGDVREIKYKLSEATSSTDKLETRVKYVENTLNLSAQKS